MQEKEMLTLERGQELVKATGRGTEWVQLIFCLMLLAQAVFALGQRKSLRELTRGLPFARESTSEN